MRALLVTVLALAAMVSPFAAGTALAAADVLICIDIDARPEDYADLRPAYQAAFEAAGAVSVETCEVESQGGTINFPPDVTVDNYPVVCVLTSENWIVRPHGIDEEDETVLASYLDTGGNLLFVGQDYMYASWEGYGDLEPGDFPYDYLGLDYCYQDVLAGEETASVSGSTGWIFEGETFELTAASVFLSSDFFIDCCTPVPARGAGYGLYYDDASQDGCMIYNDAGTFKTVWSGAELAGASQSDFNLMIERIYNWLLGITPVEESSWTHIKAMYR